MFGWLGLMLLADLTVAASSPPLQFMVFACGIAGIVAMALRRRYRVESFAILAGLSMLTSVVMASTGTTGIPGAAETGALLVLVLGVIRHVEPVRTGGDPRLRRPHRADGRSLRPRRERRSPRLRVPAVRRLVDDRRRRRLPPLPAGAPQRGRPFRTAHRATGAGQGAARPGRPPHHRHRRTGPGRPHRRRDQPDGRGARARRHRHGRQRGAHLDAPDGHRAESTTRRPAAPAPRSPTCGCSPTGSPRRARRWRSRSARASTAGRSPPR